MGLPTEGTLLVLDSFGVPLYSARGLTQVLTPIQAASNVRRDINGNLHDLSQGQFQKYATKITCTDLRTVYPDNLWPGMEVTIQCVHELHYAVGGSPQRPVVYNSSRTEGDFVFYRPIIIFRIINLSEQTAEYPADVAWEIDAEEV